MKTIFITGGKLAIICAIAAAALGFVNSVTEPKIEAIKAANLEDALRIVAPEGTPGSEVPVGKGAVNSYYPLEKDGSLIGYILRLKGTGYGGDMNILAGYDPDGRIQAAVLMENEETPGLGKEAEKSAYMKKYLGTGAERQVPVAKKDLSAEDAETISGASVTFAGIGRALASGSEFVRSQGGGK